MQGVADQWKELFDANPQAIPPLEKRTGLMHQTERTFTGTSPLIRDKVERFVRACYASSTELTTSEMGDSDERFRVCQRLIAGCLPYVDALPDRLAMDIVSQMSPRLDLDAKPLSADTISAYRNLYVEKRLRLWQRIVTRIEETWVSDDPANRVVSRVYPGLGYSWRTKREEISDPEVRKDFERRIAENHAKALRNTEQHEARLNRSHWLNHALRRNLSAIYTRGPVTANDLEVLKAYLRIYVSDEQLRKELFEQAETGAKSPSR